MMLAAIAPERVRSLLLFAPANPYSRHTDWILSFYASRIGGLIAQLAPALPKWVQRIALRRMFGDPTRIPEDSLEPYRDALRVPGTISHVLAIVRCWFSDMEKLRRALPSTAPIPTLLVWGDRDRVVSVESGRKLERDLGAELVVFSGGGHLLFEELPNEVNRLMVDWLESR